MEEHLLFAQISNMNANEKWAVGSVNGNQERMHSIAFEESEKCIFNYIYDMHPYATWRFNSILLRCKIEKLNRRTMNAEYSIEWVGSKVDNY